MNNIFRKALLSFFILSVASGLLYICGRATITLAQSTVNPEETDWKVPINLSQSGSTSNPQLIYASTGRFIALWVDKFNGYMTTDSIDGNIWSTPVPVDFPFGTKDGTPVFVPDSLGFVHAFWTNSSGALLYARILADSFSNSSAWENYQILAESAIDFSAQIDKIGSIQLAYVRILSNEGAPSGIYYRASHDNGANWDNSRSLYLSEYYRSLTSGGASVDITTANDNSVYVVWDNRPLKLILFSKSKDSGNSWSDPFVFQGPNDEAGNNIDFGATLIVNESGMLITWQSGQPDANCDQYSQWSTDDGSSWDTPQLIIESTFGCTPEKKFTILQNGMVLLIENIENQPVLFAWDGSQWSNRQNIITSFFDPETMNYIIYSGLQIIIANGNELYVVGYDDSGIGDTWFTGRSIDSILNWFPNRLHWSEAEIFNMTSNEISSVSSAIDGKDQVHIMWIQDSLINNNQSSSIYYSKSDGNQWSQPLAVYTPSQGLISNLDMAVDNDRLLVVWSEGPSNQIQFSWSNVDTAQNPSEWTAPKLLSTIEIQGRSPQLQVDQSGMIYVVYTKPINENRGIFAVKSSDGGNSWSTPIQVFNAQSAGWEVVDTPELTTDQNGEVYVSWAEKSFPEDGHLTAFYTSQSGDQGITWSSPKMVEEGKLTWGSISGNLSSSLYRTWQEVDTSTQSVNWFQLSIDGGITWSVPTGVTDPETNIGFPIITTDRSGRLFFFQPIRLTPQINAITYRIWDTDRWVVKDRIFLDEQAVLKPGTLSTSISSSGKLGIVYLEKGSDANTGAPNYSLAYISQFVDIPSIGQAPIPTATIDASMTPTSSDNSNSGQTPTANATAAQPSSESNPGTTSTSSGWTGIIIGGSIAAIVVATVLVYKSVMAMRR